MCSGSEAGSYLRLIDCVYHSTLGLRVMKKKKKQKKKKKDGSQRGGAVPVPTTPGCCHSGFCRLEPTGGVLGFGFWVLGFGFRF